MPYYVTFLLDLAGSGENRAIQASVAYAPAPDQRPKTAFVWKVTCDAAGNVIVRGLEGRKLVVIATARWEALELTSFKQRTTTTPTGYQWNLVEKALLDEQTKRAADAPLDPGPTENMSELEAKLSGRDRDWSGEMPEYAAATPSTTAGSEVQRRKRIVLALASLGGTLVTIGAVTAIVVSRGKQVETPVTPPPVAVAVQPEPPMAPVPEPPVPRTPEEKVAAASTIDEAIALAKPAMTDTDEALGPGATLLARYARMKWADLDVPPETTLPHVLKDPELERGKRVCITGEIDRIERRDVEKRKVYVGRMHTEDGDAVEFVAVGTTGELVKRSRSKFCGVVIGRADDAAKVVGMFDLPENQSPAVEQ